MQSKKALGSTQRRCEKEPSRSVRLKGILNLALVPGVPAWLDSRFDSVRVDWRALLIPEQGMDEDSITAK